MKKLARVVPILVLIAVFALVPALTAFAQGGGTNALCGGLSDADCKILTDAQAKLQGTTSFTAPSWSVSFNATTSSDTIKFDAKGSGAFSFKSQTDFLVDLKVDQFSATSKGKTQSASGLEAIINPQKVFVQYNGTWYAEDLSASSMSGMNLGSLSGMMGGGQGGMSMSQLEQMGIKLDGVVTTARGADATVGSAKVAVFTTNIDVIKLVSAVLASPAVGQALGGMMGGTSGSTSGLKPEDMQMVGALIGPMLTGTTLSVEQSIGLDDSLLHAVKVDAVLSLDASMLSPSTGKIAGEFHFAGEFGNVNEPVNVTIPTDTKPMSDLKLPAAQ